MGTGGHNAGGNLAMDYIASHPGGSSNIPSRFMLKKPELNAGLMGHLARMQTLPYLFFLRLTVELAGKYAFIGIPCCFWYALWCARGVRVYIVVNNQGCSSRSRFSSVRVCLSGLLYC